jgi:hypothetical protein
MDSAVSTAARALAAGDPLGALKWVALRHDAPALALRGTAMAQLGELARARALLRRAAAAFGPAEPAAHARCVIAQAEVALALRDVSGAERGLDAAARVLARRGDRENAAFARLIDARRLALLGNGVAAELALQRLRLDGAPARLVAIAHCVGADLAMKRLDARAAADRVERARAAAESAGIPALRAEVEALAQRLAAPVARLRRAGEMRPLGVAELAALFRTDGFFVDAGRREVRVGARVVSLVSRPVLLELAVALAETAPGVAARDALIERVFGARRANESHRVRLRVEVGRLRKVLGGVARIDAKGPGFCLLPNGAGAVSLLLPPSDGEASALYSLLAGGEAWATSGLAAAVGKSQRAVQRALAELESAGKVRGLGRGRSRRWIAKPTLGIATTLLLVAPGSLG